MSDLKMAREALQEVTDLLDASNRAGDCRCDYTSRAVRNARSVLSTLNATPAQTSEPAEGFDPMNDAEFDAALRDHYERSTYELGPEALKKAGESVIADVLAGKEEDVAMRAALDYLASLKSTLSSTEAGAPSREAKALAFALEKVESFLNGAKNYPEAPTKLREAAARMQHEVGTALCAHYGHPSPPAPAGLEEREGVELIRALTHYANILEYDDPSLRQFEATDLSKRLRSVLALLSQPPAAEATYQARVGKWMLACFGGDITNDKTERAFRFLEEALELVQALGATREQANTLVDYTFNRPVGEVPQEIGGVMVCLAALCGMTGDDMEACAEAELARVWTKIDKIRAKHAAKPKDVKCSLPGYASPAHPEVAEMPGRETARRADDLPDDQPA